MPPSPRQVIIDTDPGVDDAWAIALALASPELNVLALTTVAGNWDLVTSTRNALTVLSLLGRPSIQVAAGAQEPLMGFSAASLENREFVRRIHGPSGLGGLPASAIKPSFAGPHAVAVMAELLERAAPRTVTIVALAPLTNLALLFDQHPEQLGAIDRVVMMGGSGNGVGNVTPLAEFNVWADPEAAYRVLREPSVEISMIGLDTTERAAISPADLKYLESPAGQALGEMARGYGDVREDGWPLHDVVVVAALLDDAVVRTEPATVDVDTSAGPRRGHTDCTFRPADSDRQQQGDEPMRLVATDLDLARFRDLVIGRLGNL